MCHEIENRGDISLSTVAGQGDLLVTRSAGSYSTCVVGSRFGCPFSQFRVTCRRIVRVLVQDQRLRAMLHWVEGWQPDTFEEWKLGPVRSVVMKIVV